MIRFSVFCTAVIFLLSLNKLTAQDKKKVDPQTFKDGKISGIVVDAATLEPLEGCSCSLVLYPAKKFLKGTAAGKDGRFELKDIPFGMYDLRISFVGYKTTRVTKILVYIDKYQINLDTLRLKPSAVTTSAVNITGKKERVVYENDKITFNVDSDIQAMGGTAADVLEVVPMVTVDISGNIGITGRKKAKIYIDGIEARLLGFDNADALQALPAADVEKIEVITEPSAEYDAGVSSGVINIITRRSIAGSYGGGINADAGTKNRYNSGLRLNYSYRDISASLNYQNNYSLIKSSGNSLRISTLNDNTRYLLQSDNDNAKNNTNGVRLNGRYDFSKLTYLNAAAAFRNTHSNNTGNVLSRFSSDGILYGTSIKRDRNTVVDRDLFNLNLNFLTRSADKEREFSSVLSYMNNLMDSRSGLDQNTFTDTLIFPVRLSKQTNYSLNRNNIISLSAKYLQRISSGGLLVIKYNGSYSSRSLKNSYFNYDYPHSLWNENINDKTNQLFDEHKHSLNFDSWKEFYSIRIDPRLKLDYYQTGLKEKLSGRTDNFSFLEFLPQIKLSRTKQFEGISLSYSREADYPENKQLNPHVDYSDSLNIFSGNPELRPSFTDGFSFTISKYIFGMLWYANASYSKTTGIIEPYTYMENLTTARTTYRNAGTSDSYSANLFLTDIGIKYMSLTPVIQAAKTIYHSPSKFSNEVYWYAGFRAGYRIDILRFNADFDYYSAQITSQEKTKGVFRLNMGVSARLLDNKLYLSLKATDPFNLLKTDSDRYGAGFVYKSYKKEDTRVFTLSITYSLQKLIEEDTEQEDIIDYKDDF